MGWERFSCLMKSLSRELMAEAASTGTPFGHAGETPALAPMTAFNPSEAERGFDDFIGVIVNQMKNRFQVPPQLAVGIIVAVAREYAAAGRLPPFPDARASDTRLGIWTAAAMTSDFKVSVIDAARQLVDSESEAREYGRR